MASYAINTSKYSQTLLALQASLSSSISHHERTQYEAYLLQSKQSNDREFVDILLFILSVDNNEHSWDIRTLTLTLFHDWIVASWLELAPDLQQYLRSTVLTLASKQEMSKSFRMKLASVLSNFAVRQFPQLWDSFIDDMLSLLRTGIVDIQELGTQTLDFTVTDCIDASLAAALPAARKQEVLGGIKAQLTIILSSVYSCLSHHMQVYLSPASTVATKTQSVNVILASLRMTKALISFSKPVEVCTRDHNFAIICIDMLQFPDFQQESLQLLSSICQYSLSFELFIIIVERLITVPIAALFSRNCDSTSNVISFGESCHYLLSHNTTLLLDSHNHQALSSITAQELMVAYVKLLLSILQLPIHEIVLNIVGEWTKILRCQGLYELFPWLNQLASAVMQVFLDRLQIVAKKATKEKDRDGEIDWTKLQSTLLTGMQSLISVLAKQQPLSVLEAVSDWVQLSCKDSLPSTMSSSLASSSGHVEPLTFSSQWTCHISLLSTSIKHIVELLQHFRLESNDKPAALLEANKLQSALLALLQMFLTWQVEGYTLQSLRMQFILCFKSYFSLGPESDMIPWIGQSLSLCFDHFTKSITGSCGDIANLQLRQYSFVVADSAIRLCECVVAVCGLDSAFANQVATQLLSLHQSFAAQQGGPIPFLQRSIEECLVILTANFQNPAAKEYVISTVITPSVTVLREAIATIQTLPASIDFLQLIFEYCSTVQNLPIFTNERTNCSFEVINIYFAAMENMHIPIHHTLHLVLLMLERLLLLAKRYPVKAVDNVDIGQLAPAEIVSRCSGFFTMWIDLLPILLKLTQQIDSIYTSSVRNILESQLGRSVAELVYLPTTVELNRETGLDSNVFSEEQQKQQHNSQQQSHGDPDKSNCLGKLASFYIYFLRKLIYQLFAICSRHRLLYFYSDHLLLMQYIASSMSMLENVHMTELSNRLLMNYLIHIPKVLLNGEDGGSFVCNVLLPLLKSYSDNILQRLTVLLSSPSDIMNKVMSLGAENSRTQYQEVIIRYKYSGYQILFQADFVNESAAKARSNDANPYSQAKEFIETNMMRSFVDILYVLFIKHFGKKSTSVSSHSSGNASSSSSSSSVINGSEDNSIDLPTLILSHPAAQQYLPQLLKSIIAVLYFPDSMVIRRSLAILKYLCQRAKNTECMSHPLIVYCVGKESFSTLLTLVLTEVQWINGIETEIVEYLMDVYCLLVLAIDSDSVATSASPAPVAVGGAILPRAYHPGVEQPKLISTEPRKVCLEGYSIPITRITELERQLIASHGSKKKRKDIFRDFIGECIRLARKLQGISVEGGSKASATGLVSKNVTNIDPSSTGRMDEALASLQAAPSIDESLAEGSLAAMFGSS